MRIVFRRYGLTLTFALTLHWGAREHPKLSPIETLESECRARGVDVDEVLSTGIRTRRVTAARHATARRLRDVNRMSYPKIGQALGMDASSVRYACRPV